jgi:hypothetical protein
MIPEGTTFLGVVLKQLLVGASAFSVGIMLFRALFYERKRHRPFLSLGFASVAGLLVIIGELVVRAPFVDPDLRAILYFTFLVGATVGFAGDSVRGYRRGEVTPRRRGKSRRP